VRILKARVRVAIVLAVGGLLGSATASEGQTPSERAVRAVVDSFFAAIKRERWDSAVALIDLSRFEPYFKQQVQNARSAIPQPEMTVEDMMASDSTMPRAVAEWQVAQMNKYRGMRKFGDMSYEFAGVHSQHELFALTVPEAASRWLEAQDGRTQMREAFRQSGCSPKDLPTELYTVKPRVLGVAIADDSTAYVVHDDNRFSGELFGSELERVMVLHRRGGHWRIDTRQDLLRPGNLAVGMIDCPGRRKK